MVELWQSWAVLKISYLMFCKSFIKYDVSNQRSLKLLSQSHFILQLKLYCTCTIYLFTKISHIFQWALSIRWKVMIFNFRKFPGTKETAFYTVFPEKKGTEIFGNILSGILVPFDFPLEFPEFWFAFLKFNISRIFCKSPKEILVPFGPLSKVSEFVFECIWKVFIASIWKRSRC